MTHPQSLQELQPLHPLLRNLGDQSEQVVDRLYRLYADRCGESRTLESDEFSGILSPLLRSGTTALVDGDFQQFAALGRLLGERLAQRGVPFFEAMLTLQLFHESVEALCLEKIPSQLESVFAQLCHFHATLVAEGYIRTESARLVLRVEAAAADDSRSEEHVPREFHGLLGASPIMRRIYARIEAAGRARGMVLIIGESGTGKELVARAIHGAGPNPEAPFVAVNCPAIPRELIESELFGHKRGAFSGASVDYLGLFRAAEGGTLLLDEVTEMNLETQSKLLRALQERAVRPVGSVAEVAVNVRVIASTNRSPAQAVRQGLLREDLYYRLQANVIEIPPLRRRANDIPLLVSHFIRTFNPLSGRSLPVTGIAQDAMAALLRYSWPGNVRELSNAIESAVTFGRTSRIRLKDLPEAVRQNQPDAAPRRPDDAAGLDPQAPSAREPAALSPKTFDETERELIERALQTAGHNKTYAAELLKISRKKLYARLAKYGLLNQRRRAAAPRSVVCTS